MHRTSYTSSGVGVHGIQNHNEHINATFRDACDNWARNLDYWTRNYPPSSGTYTIDWFGEVGLGYCKAGMHGEARAFDLTHVRFTNGYYADMNWSWRQNTLHKRRYLAIAAQCRRYHGIVLTWWHDNARYGEDRGHYNHLHFDNGSGNPPIRTGWISDATLVQASCNLLNGESLAIDGAWGSLTESAYLRLLSKFNLRCYDPKSSTSAKNIFLSFVVRTAFANKSAGYYRSTAC
jgi:hypothetical protein